jgi:hypothetical protein
VFFLGGTHARVFPPEYTGRKGCRTAESFSDHRAVGGGLAGGRGRDPAVGREGRARWESDGWLRQCMPCRGALPFPSCGAELILGSGLDLRQTCYGSLSTWQVVYTGTELYKIFGNGYVPTSVDHLPSYRCARIITSRTTSERIYAASSNTLISRVKTWPNLNPTI